MLDSVLCVVGFTICHILGLGFWSSLLGLVVLPWLFLATCRRLKLVHFDSSLDHGDCRRAVLLPTEDWSKYSWSEEYVKGRSGNLLYVQTFLPARPPRSVVVFIHGYGDHTGFLKSPIFGRILDQGHALVALDHSGHGRSDGLHGYVPSFQALVADVAHVIALAKANKLQQALPKVKYFGWGESMGGGMCLKLSLDHPGAVDGVLLFAPMCRISDKMTPPDFVVKTLLFVRSLWPTLPITPTPDLIDKCFQRKEILQAARENPLGYRRWPRLGTATEMLHASLDIQSRMSDITIPFCVVHGKDDLVTDPQCSVDLYNRAKTSPQDKKLGLYDHCWHGIALEPDAFVQQMWVDVFSWLDSRI